MTIYAISNIHDVSWGSRPQGDSVKENNAKIDTELEYKRYRSNFLIFWIIINTIAGYAVIWFSRTEQEWYLNLITSGLALIIVFKFGLSLFHTLQNSWNKCCLGSYMNQIDKGLTPLPNRELSKQLVNSISYFIPHQRTGLNNENEDDKNLNQERIEEEETEEQKRDEEENKEEEEGINYSSKNINQPSQRRSSNSNQYEDEDIVENIFQNKKKEFSVT